MNDRSPAGPYQPSWESLTTHPVPQWFADAKFGIYFHWGIYSVPAFVNEWYSRSMYQPGAAEYEHHIATYGPQSDFGYKDFLPMFTAEHFDPDEWAELFVRAGARYAGPVAEHADGFAMWDSRLTEWNAARLGPKRDIVGEMARAVRARNLKFYCSFHHQWLWAWYPTDDPSVDCGRPEFSGLYGPPAPQSAFWPNNDPLPPKEFCDLWLAKVVEVIDRYQPDEIYFDSRMFIIDEDYRLRMLAHYYNRAAEWGREVALTYKGGDLAEGAGIEDVERGRMTEVVPSPWQTDDSVDLNSWCDVQNPSYKSATRLVHDLIDIVSKSGNYLLNITPTAQGIIPDPVRERLLAMGDWLAVNGEAIYSTRPWETFGEGPTRMTGGHFGDIPDFTPEDIRFTTKPDALYAICCGWPGGEVLIESLPAGRKLWFGDISDVRMLGVDRPLTWTRDDRGLTVQFPSTRPCDHAFVLKIT
jgi:alpha-L-fucosidase